MNDAACLQTAREHDAQDQLAYLRKQFLLPTETVYLDGNSLGPLTQTAQVRAQEVIAQQWGKDLITSWNKHQWIDLPLSVGNKIAPLLGAAPGQVICCDSISVNLFKLVCGAISMQPDRKQIITTADNFPTDRYMLQGITQFAAEKGLSIKSVDEQDILQSIDGSVAVMLLTQVNYRSGNRLDIQTITQRAHEQGVIVIWDLAHSAGVLALELDAWDVDFAVGCGYKYLNGGPGAPAFMYVAKRHQDRFKQPLQGWMGHATPFTFDPDYVPDSSIKQNLVGTPQILSMSVLDAALDVFRGLDMRQVESKALALRDLFLRLLEALDIAQWFEIHANQEVQHSGAQVALMHADAYAICQAWIGAGVIADFRAPNILRVGFSPLFLRFEDIALALFVLRDIMREQRYLDENFQTKHQVT
ncbi:kynureninase [Alteromonas flava]|uniref:kynureninase n=1 Tax=Alteromonas flava TaxID=2048003 RepID=UPI000C290166|nr:kynureninase [Alteromonas flava]